MSFVGVMEVVFCKFYNTLYIYLYILQYMNAHNFPLHASYVSLTWRASLHGEFSSFIKLSSYNNKYITIGVGKYYEESIE